MLKSGTKLPQLTVPYNRNYCCLNTNLSQKSQSQTGLEFSWCRLHLYSVQLNLKYQYFTGVTYILVYRTEKYKKLKASIEKQTKKRMLFQTYSRSDQYNMY